MIGLKIFVRVQLFGGGPPCPRTTSATLLKCRVWCKQTIFNNILRNNEKQQMEVWPCQPSANKGIPTTLVLSAKHTCLYCKNFCSPILRNKIIAVTKAYLALAGQYFWSKNRHLPAFQGWAGIPVCLLNSWEFIRENFKNYLADFFR